MIPDSPSPDRPVHRMALVSAVDQALLDLVALTLHGEDALVIATTVHPEIGEHGVVRLTATPAQDPDPLSDQPAVLDVDMPTSCTTCSLREVLLAVAEDRAAAEPGGTTVVLLPPALEIVHLAPRLAAQMHDLPGVELAGVAHAILTATAADDLLTHVPLAERSLAQGLGDSRCTGEVHMVALGYADVVIAVGPPGPGADLVEHLRADDALLLPGLEAPVLEVLTSLRHDADAALARVHPATTRAWGGPVTHGVRTLDLTSDLPFHPGRLRELVTELAGAGMCARGCFWLPSRPGRVCAWEVAGGAITVGDAGTWQEAPVHPEPLEEVGGQGEGDLGGPHCHLVITALADDDACQRVRGAFERILLRPEEMGEALAWAGGQGDDMEDWFGTPGCLRGGGRPRSQPVSTRR